MRPAFHFTTRAGWINDPHGITVHDGAYHAFFQWVPGRTTWAPNCHWGHASGPDLLSLTELPVAIAPGDGDDGIWTGSLVRDGSDTRIFYTSVTLPDIGIGRVRVARPESEDWISWTKGDVVVEAPTGMDIVAYRDPFLRREGANWRMFVGAGLKGGTAMALTYTSPDLDTWTYDGIALQRSSTETEPVWMGALWECPQIFTIGDRAVMVSSVWDDDVLHYAGYAVGTYADGRFAASAWGRLTFGESYYAPSFFVDADGQPCLSFWMRGIADVETGWASAHSVPYRLRLDGDVLIAQPHPDVARHRISRSREGRVDCLAADIEWENADGELVVVSGGADVVRVRCTGDELEVRVGAAEHRVPGGRDVRVIVDGPVLEVSSTGGLFGATLAPAGDGLEVTATAGRVVVHEVR